MAIWTPVLLTNRYDLLLPVTDSILICYKLRQNMHAFQKQTHHTNVVSNGQVRVIQSALTFAMYRKQSQSVQHEYVLS